MLRSLLQVRCRKGSHALPATLRRHHTEISSCLCGTEVGHAEAAQQCWASGCARTSSWDFRTCSIVSVRLPRERILQCKIKQLWWLNRVLACSGWVLYKGMTSSGQGSPDASRAAAAAAAPPRALPEAARPPACGASGQVEGALPLSDGKQQAFTQHVFRGVGRQLDVVGARHDCSRQAAGVRVGPEAAGGGQSAGSGGACVQATAACAPPLPAACCRSASTAATRGHPFLC